MNTPEAVACCKERVKRFQLSVCQRHIDGSNQDELHGDDFGVPNVMVTENGSMLGPGFRFLKLTPMEFLTEWYGTSRNSCTSLSTYTLFEVPLKLKSGPKPSIQGCKTISSVLPSAGGTGTARAAARRSNWKEGCTLSMQIIGSWRALRKAPWFCPNWFTR